MREKTTVLKVALALFCALLFAPAAKAHQTPQACTPGDPKISFSEETVDRLSEPVRQGDEIELGLTIASPGFDYCYISDISVSLQEPNPDGSAGAERPIDESIDAAPGGSQDRPATAVYVVNLNQDVFQAPLGLRWQATIHDGDQDRVIAGEGTGTTFNLTRPTAELQVIPDPFQGPAPLTVTYTYLLTNTSIAPETGERAPALVPTGPGGPTDVLTDGTCGSVEYQSGDEGAGDRLLLSPGETWRFTCSRTFDGPGKFSNSPTITGNSDVDGRPWPQVTTSPEVTSLGSDLTVEKTHQGDFFAGSTGSYTINVTNSGNQQTTGPVTVTDELPSGMSAKSMGGNGWSCDRATSTCTRGDTLPPGSSYPPVSLVVSLHNNPPTDVINRVNVEGGGEVEGARFNNRASDPTKIRRPSQPAAAKGRTFKIKRVSSLTNGKVRLKVAVPGPGRLQADDRGKPDLVRRATRKVGMAKTVTVVLVPKQKLRRAIGRSGKPRKVRLRVVFKARHDASIAGKLSAARAVFFLPPSN